MNDRFRFRVWDKSEECYIDSNDCAIFYIEPNGEITIGIYSNSDVGDVIYCEEENLCVEQCTGLKDKNGRLIYEGDIVKVTGDVMTIPVQLEGNVAKVVWEINCFCLRFPYEDESYFSECWDYEVIGNIHENEDFLEVKK